MNISGQKPAFPAASIDLCPDAATDIMCPEMTCEHRYGLLPAAMGGTDGGDTVFPQGDDLPLYLFSIAVHQMEPADHQVDRFFDGPCSMPNDIGHAKMAAAGDQYRFLTLDDQ